MDEWRQSTIGDLCDAGTIELSTGPFGSQLHAYDYVDVGVPVVPTEAIRDRQIDKSVLPKISESKAAELVRHRLEADDILFARRGVQATGHIGFIREEEAGFLCGTGAIRLRVMSAGGGVDPGFLSHVLADPRSVQWFKYHAIGATMPNLNEGIIRSFPLFLPRLPEQRAIASILGTLDDKIELNRRMNETLEQLAEVLYSRAMAGGARGAFTLGLEIRSGGTPKTQRSEYWGGDIPWISIKDLEQGAFVIHTEKSITKAGSVSSAAKVLPDLSVILSARGTVGRVAMTTGDMAANQSCYALVSRHPYETYHRAKSAAALLRAHAHGSIFDTITRDTLEGLEVSIPSDVRRFDVAVAPLYAMVLSNACESQTLVRLRDTLLPKLTSGEIRVKHAEQLVEAIR